MERPGGGPSLLETVGAEITGIVAPVSICMLLVVLLVHRLSPHGSDASSPVVQSVATLVYAEKPSDSTSQKLEGALLNSLVFVAVVALVTFLLVLLYYFRCVKFLKYYMCASAASVLAFMGGAVLLQLLQSLSIPLDIFTFLLLLFNFTVVGVLAVFLPSMPILVTQSYLVVIGMLVAFWFTMLPEWTTWMLLVAMALYDLVAVLAPGGPLKLLVELAISRDEEIPALVYEARPVSVTREDAHPPPDLSSQEAASTSSSSSDRYHHRPRRWKKQRRSQQRLQDGGASTEMQPLNSTSLGRMLQQDDVEGTQGEGGGGGDLERRMSQRHGDESEAGVRGRAEAREMEIEIEEMVEDESVPLMLSQGGGGAPAGISGTSLRRLLLPDGTAATQGTQETEAGEEEEEEEEEGLGLSASGSLKLGLGDFVFYSLLVGRAAMYDLMTVYACYLAIIAGLGSTLILLAVAQRALPALPISIGLGVIFYFLTRLLLEPFVAGLSTSLLMF